MSATAISGTALRLRCLHRLVRTRRILLLCLFLALSLALASQPATAQTTAPSSINIVTWNIGLDDADLETIGMRLAAFEGVDLWGLQEVTSRSAPAVLSVAAAVGEDDVFAAVQGRAGDGLHLVAIYNADRFDLLKWWEIDAINTTGNVRPPLVLHLKDRASGLEFLFMVNHLYRSRDAERHKQAELLNAWATTQTLPVVAVGDYNFDWAVVGGERNHDTGYDLMTAGEVWQWVRPETLTTSQCSGWPCRYNSVLDFVFTSGPAQRWLAESVIVVEVGDFPDDASTSDHRPVAATVWAGGLAETTSASLVVANANANLRSGPGTTYAVAGGTRTGEPLEIIGRNDDGSWLQLADGLWIAAFLVDETPIGLGVVGQTVVTPTPTSESQAADVVNLPAPTATPVAAVTATPAPTATQPPTLEPAPSEPASAPAVQLVILTNRSSEEILEIRNVGAGLLDLGGWWLDGSKGDDVCIIPRGTTLAPGAGYQVATGDSQLQGAGLKCGDKPIWNNNGETIYLRGPQGLILSIESVRR